MYPDSLLTYRESARILKVSPRSIQRWVTEGRLPVVTITKRTKRISLNMLMTLTQSGDFQAHSKGEHAS